MIADQVHRLVAEEIVDELLDIYQEDSPDTVRRIREAAASGDDMTLRAAAHSLKSSSWNVHARPLARLLERLEGAAALGDHETVAHLLPQVESEYGAVMEILRGRVAAA